MKSSNRDEEHKRLPVDRRIRQHLAVGLSMLTSACGGEVATQSISDEPSASPPDGSMASAGGAAPQPAPTFVDPAPTTPPITPVPQEPPACDLSGVAGSSASLFAPYVVTHYSIAHPTIYSWTSLAQIDELRTNPTLLTRSMTADGQMGRAADYILAMAQSDDIAALLAQPEFANKRFGWTSPWPTLVGPGGDAYGDQLLEIHLRPEAWVGQLLARTASWEFFDMAGNPVPLGQVRANPERIAAVYFVDDYEPGGCGSTFFGTVPYREYFVCNEGMVESWSVNTPEILNELTENIAVLEAFQRALVDAGCESTPFDVSCWTAEVLSLWSQSPQTMLDSYGASVAFPTDAYFPSSENVGRLIALLQAALFNPDPLVHSYTGGTSP